MVPHLKTALNGPLLELEKSFLEHSAKIEFWFREQWQRHQPTFYSSCDLRNSGFKLAPVDTNLFPGGFNNLNRSFFPLCVQAAISRIESICPNAQKVLLIPENHTRNLFYLENVFEIANILKLAGLEVRIGSLIPDLKENKIIELNGNKNICLEPLIFENGKLKLKDFEPCLILLNNDLSAGAPDFLKTAAKNQLTLPPIHAGWKTRRKSNHFAAYDRVVNDFARHIGIDAWRINPAFGVCQSVNFHERQGEECLTHSVAVVLERVRAKYKEYGIEEQPFVVVKADAGTYGMGIMTVYDARDVVALNRKQRNKMSVIKEGQEVSEVLIQEGVHTFETLNDAAAEPVVYMMDKFVVGGFYRVHTSRGKDENLNAPGMHFEPLAFETGCHQPDCSDIPDAPPNRFYAYGVVARLASLAASLELEETAPND